ncbi:MAG: SpoVA/SpoVAEb family sporulation membrane protein [Lachnospiraceae bacterium]|nr:SpoVA/SpoVAEb family sporulation membrane protein [Lachnospiraceae bacterium]MDD3616895.1 SpoVA/SpoVAEb family sporulation membrane protein [Lachnospiraceae bacterium]
MNNDIDKNLNNNVDKEIIEKENYEKYVKQITPVHNLAANMARAFLVGGIICVLGQCIVEIAQKMGAKKEDAILWCALILIFLSVLLTGLNVYGKLAKFGGAGTLVPITGFANSVAASAIEYQKHGQVYGIGTMIFSIAGPVILYGILTSWAVGLIYWILKLMGVLG